MQEPEATVEDRLRESIGTLEKCPEWEAVLDTVAQMALAASEMALSGRFGVEYCQGYRAGLSQLLAGLRAVQRQEETPAEERDPEDVASDQVVASAFGMSRG